MISIISKIDVTSRKERKGILFRSFLLASKISDRRAKWEEKKKRRKRKLYHRNVSSSLEELARVGK